MRSITVSQRTLKISKKLILVSGSKQISCKLYHDTTNTRYCVAGDQSILCVNAWKVIQQFRYHKIESVLCMVGISSTNYQETHQKLPFVWLQNVNPDSEYRLIVCGCAYIMFFYLYLQLFIYRLRENNCVHR